ncbi:hypothetical protein EJA72_00480, partial [Pseudomonas sp. PB120]|nr:hypothetical protein [Pseudomonas sp. PB120]
PAGLRSGPFFGAAARPSGSKLPRHRKSPFSDIPTFKIDPATLFRLPGTAARGLDKRKPPFF